MPRIRHRTLSPEEIEAHQSHLEPFELKRAARSKQLQALINQRETPKLVQFNEKARAREAREAREAKTAVRVTPQNQYLTRLINIAAATISYKNLQETETDTRLLSYNSDIKINILLQGIKQNLPQIIIEVINNVINKVKQPINSNLFYDFGSYEEEPIYAKIKSNTPIIGDLLNLPEEFINTPGLKELKNAIKLPTSGNNCDCLIHSVLTVISSDFRSLEPIQKNTVADFIRKQIFTKIEQEKTRVLDLKLTTFNECINRFKNSNNSTFLENLDLALIAEYYNLKFFVISLNNNKYICEPVPFINNINNINNNNKGFDNSRITCLHCDKHLALYLAENVIPSKT